MNATWRAINNMVRRVRAAESAPAEPEGPPIVYDWWVETYRQPGESLDDAAERLAVVRLGSLQWGPVDGW